MQMLDLNEEVNQLGKASSVRWYGHLLMLLMSMAIS